MRRGWVLLVVLAPTSPGCVDPCEEDLRAQVLPLDGRVTVAGTERRAEIADDAVERDRGWRHRRCDREALVLIPDEPGPLPIWGCALAEPVDVLFVHASAVVELVSALAPCPEPCDACPSVGDALEVDYVVELPAGELPVAVGDPVTLEP